MGNSIRKVGTAYGKRIDAEPAVGEIHARNASLTAQERSAARHLVPPSSRPTGTGRQVRIGGVDMADKRKWQQPGQEQRKGYTSILEWHLNPPKNDLPAHWINPSL